MRRALPLILTSVLFGLLGSADSARSASIAETDHLIPVGEILPADYYALLQRKLFVSRANFVRVVDFPGGENEVAIAIYSVESRGGENVRITYTRCDKNLWSVGSDSQGHFVKDPSVSVKRIDAPFPKELALTVSRAVKRALGERRPRPPPRPTDTVTVDGRLVEFSISTNSQIKRRLLTPDARGKKAQRLHRLTDLLERYCLASAAERTTIEPKIAVEAAKIAGETVHSQRPNQAMERTTDRFALHF